MYEKSSYHAIGKPKTAGSKSPFDDKIKATNGGLL
jgi:hypothetical protein